MFFYDIFPETHEAMAREGLTLHYLATWRDVLAEARAGNHFPEATLTAVEAFLNDPFGWSGAHGGISEFAV